MINEEYLVLVSDGSLKYIHMMSFAWILASPSGKWIAAACGPGSGEGSSLRIEADGMLSGSLCCSILADELKLPASKFRIRYICDNSSLINNCIDRLTYTVPFPNTTLRSEFDLIEEIYQTNKQHGIISQFEWQKGHLDDEIEEEELPLIAQLNVNADTIAKEWTKEKGEIFIDSFDDLVPSNTAALIIEGSHVTSNYYNRLLESYSEGKYIEYLQN